MYVLCPLPRSLDLSRSVQWPWSSGNALGSVEGLGFDTALEQSFIKISPH